MSPLDVAASIAGGIASNLLVVALVLLGTVLAAVTIAWIVVELADRIGLVYSAAREEARHADDVGAVVSSSAVTVRGDLSATLSRDAVSDAIAREISAPRVRSRPLLDRIEARREIAA